ncbi:MAG: DnaJ C-terminal domain-containing protein [Alphaproteobacteria bacterium]
MQDNDDPYQILGLGRTASKDDVRRAFRVAAKECHPDLYPDDPVRAERFRRISWAHGLLTDDAARQRHDAGQRQAPPRPQGRQQQASSRPSGEAKGGKRFRFPGIRGADVRYALQVSAAEARSGATKALQTADGRTLKVKVPAGTADGHQLRLRGQGLPGKFGGEAGDALVALQIELPSGFRRDGDDVHCEADVPLAAAVLGGKVAVETLEGAVNLSVPAGSNAGTVLRLRGRGARREDGTRGDQMVHLRLVLPEPPDPRLSALLRQWAEESTAANAR